MKYSYKYPRPAATVDCGVFGFDGAALSVLLIERRHPPFARSWALPGGFVEMNETLDDAARRELNEETGLADIFLEQLYTFGAVDRDPRERVISIAYYALVNQTGQHVRAASDARRAVWFAVDDLPPLAFDHAEIIATALQRLKGKVRYEPVGFELLPAKFTLSSLQRLYEVCLGEPIDKRNFRKKLLGLGLVRETDEFERDVSHRAARLYRFDVRRYRQLRRQGFDFWL